MPVILALLIPAPYPGAGTSAPGNSCPGKSNLVVEWEEAEASVVFYVLGDLDELTSGEFRKAVAQLPVKKRVVFELSAVPYVDSAGVAAILSAVLRVRDRGGEAVICAPRPAVSTILLSIGLDRVATACNRLEELEVRN